MTKIVSNNEYSKMVQKASPNSPIITNCIKAFFVGGLICDLGQFFINTFKSLGCTIEQSNSYTSIILIFIASLLTGLGLYSKIGKFAGATIPLLGFGNNLAKGVINEVNNVGFIGIFSGGIKSAATGVTASIAFAFIMALIFNPKEK